MPMNHKRILINSIPKSGTYLLTQLITTLGVYPRAGKLHFNDQHYKIGADASGAGIVMDTPSPEHLSVIPEGHSAPAHITWSQGVEDMLHKQDIGMLFMYRDPRDVAISYIKFAMYSDVYRYENAGHAGYYDFICTLADDQRRVEHILRYRLFLFQFYENAPWLFSKSCLPIAFEKLYGDVLLLAEGTVGKTIQGILNYIGLDTLPMTPQELFEKVHGKSKTAMPGNNKIAVYKSFYDDALYDAADNAFFRSVLHMYGYSDDALINNSSHLRHRQSSIINQILRRLHLVRRDFV